MSRTAKVSVSLDVDLIELAKERSIALGISRFHNLSAYINVLIRKDLTQSGVLSPTDRGPAVHRIPVTKSKPGTPPVKPSGPSPSS